MNKLVGSISVMNDAGDEVTILSSGFSLSDCVEGRTVEGGTATTTETFRYEDEELGFVVMINVETTSDESIVHAARIESNDGWEIASEEIYVEE